MRVRERERERMRVRERERRDWLLSFLKPVSER